MDAIVDEISRKLSRQILAEREARGWSLAELADRAGIAKATVSKIERGLASPTAVILVRLAGAFGLTLAGLMLRVEGERPRLSRAAGQPVWHDPDTGYRRQQVFSRPDHPVELIQVQMPAGQRVTMPAASYLRIRQLVWVQRGHLVLTEGAERHELGPGDCLAFGPPSDVVFANETDAPCDYVVALSRT